MKNLGSIINAHNKKVLEEKPAYQLGECNCRVKTDCPLKGHCLTSNVLYEATIKANIPNYQEKLYKGVSGTVFKTRFNNHEKAFNHVKYKNDCELSKEVWKIKDQGRQEMRFESAFESR